MKLRNHSMPQMKPTMWSYLFLFILFLTFLTMSIMNFLYYLIMNKSFNPFLKMKNM
uniref:ATP synthase F0 subunit 8 n=1 Tax=Sycobia sp. 2 JXW-2020 TaxID=2781669 RepID=A0A8A6UQC1_9HYME|nr:ATP synthase F0 subunit 8 [Sycobia sp. 2 JXW-2020]